MTYTNPFSVPGYENESFETAPTERKAKKGGGTYTIGKTEYWFPEDLYTEVLDRDNETPMTRRGDKEFAKWIKQFVKDHEDRVEKVAQTRRSRSWSAGSGMSGYWAMPYSWNKSSDSNTVRLATVLRAMKTVLSVVDPFHKLRVDYTDGSSSSWMDNQVNLPVKPAREITDLEEAINVESGFAIHEAWHSEFTRPLLDSDRDSRAWLMKDRWNQWTLNVFEDVREEARGLAKTPGCREYLNFVMEYMWDDKAKLPAKWEHGDNHINERAMCTWMFLREPDRSDELLTDESFAEPRAWFNDFIERYQAAVNATPTMDVAKPFYKEARDYLGIPDDASPPPPSLRVLTPCGLIAEDEGMNSGQKENIAEAMEAQSEEVGEKDWGTVFGEAKQAATIDDAYVGSGMNSAIILKPRILYPSLYQPSKMGLVEKAKAALSLRKTVAQADTRLMKSGILDEDELHRFFADDMRIFKNATTETIPNAAVYLLVDMSGSMGSAEWEHNSAFYAVRLAQIFVEALASHANLTVKVLGHTGDNSDNSDGGAFYRIWEPGDPINRLSLLYESDRMGNNYDGWAIAWAGQMIKKESVDQRLLIVLSDGQPNAHTYGSTAAMDHVRSVTDRLLRQGVDVVQVAVGSGIPREDQAHMFKHFIELRDELGGDPFASVFRKLTKLLQKFA
jgi:hypothetical protein